MARLDHLATAAAAAENRAPIRDGADQRRRGTVRAGILALVMVVAACSSDTAPVPPSDPTASAALLKKDCADPQWKEENLGLWYSVCRQPLRW